MPGFVVQEAWCRACEAVVAVLRAGLSTSIYIEQWHGSIIRSTAPGIYKLQIANCKLQTANYKRIWIQLQIINNLDSATNGAWRVCSCRLQTAWCSPLVRGVYLDYTYYINILEDAYGC